MRARAVVAMLAVSALASACMKDRERNQGSAPGYAPGLGTPSTQPPESAPPISGGTLLITADGEQAFVADPDRGRVMLVDLEGRKVLTELALAKGSQPGRAVEDAAGFVHVLLRGAGSVLTLSSEGDDRGQRDVCPSPRGIDYDAARDELVIACVGGELVRFAAAPGGARTSKTVLEPDLRDVVVLGEKTFVSVFRRPKVLVLDAGGALLNELEPPETGTGDTKQPTVAWRMIEWPGRGVVISHQQSSSRVIEIGADAPANSYAAGASPIVEPALTSIDEDGVIESVGNVLGGVLPVDVSVNEAGDIATTMSGSFAVTVVNAITGSVNQVGLTDQPIAAQLVGDSLVIQTRQPARLLLGQPGQPQTIIELEGDDVGSVGHTIFHVASPATPLACASCHPEGRDDGHTWSFAPLGARRTQSLLGDVTSTAPFHWDGDQKSMVVLMNEVFTRRMGNPELPVSEVAAFGDWLSGLRDLPAKKSDDSPGRKAFEKAGCDSCHSGDRFTNGGDADVGTEGTFQVPSLVGVRYRTPLLHDGCAATIEERFGPCGGDDHGDVDKLDDDELGDLIDYLKSL